MALVDSTSPQPTDSITASARSARCSDRRIHGETNQRCSLPRPIPVAQSPAHGAVWELRKFATANNITTLQSTYTDQVSSLHIYSTTLLSSRYGTVSQSQLKLAVAFLPQGILMRVRSRYPHPSHCFTSHAASRFFKFISFTSVSTRNNDFIFPNSDNDSMTLQDHHPNRS